jgi:hypothetical protein
MSHLKGKDDLSRDKFCLPSENVELPPMPIRPLQRWSALKVTGGSIKLHNAELHNLYCVKYCQGNETKKDEMVWACEKCMQILIGNPEGKRAFGRPECGLDSFELKAELRALMNRKVGLRVL